MWVTSSRTTVMSGSRSMASVTAAEKFSRSTASACPAGTAVCAAICIRRELDRRISSFSSQGAVFSLSDFSEFEHTSSAKCAVWCAGVCRTGRISYSSAGTPRRAHCHAASDPASPAPMMRTFSDIAPTNCKASPYLLTCGMWASGSQIGTMSDNTYPFPLPPEIPHFHGVTENFRANSCRRESYRQIPLNKGVTGDVRGRDGRLGGEMSKNATASRASHRSNRLLGMRVVSGCRVQGRQLSLILPRGVYGQEGEAARAFVTVQCDKDSQEPSPQRHRGTERNWARVKSKRQKAATDARG